MGTPTQVCVWSCPNFSAPAGRPFSAGQPAVESLGGGTGVRVGRGGRGKRPREGNDECVDDLDGQGNDQGLGANRGIEGVNGNVEGANRGAPDFSTIIAQQLQNLLPAMLDQVSNRGNIGNQNGNVVNENIQVNVGNVIVNGNRVCCLYKEFLACNPKEYDGKGGAVVLTRWIEKMKSVHDMSGCSVDQKVKFTVGSFLEFCPSHEMQKLESELWNHAMVRAGHAAYVYGLAPQIRKMVAATEPKTIQKDVQISGALTDEAVRNGSIKKVEKRGNMGEPSKHKNGTDDNKRTRTGNAFTTTVNPVGRENTFVKPGNRLGVRDSSWAGREASQDSNICEQCLDPIDLGFIYEIEIASGQLVEIDKVIKGCKLEIYVMSLTDEFDNLLGMGFYDVIYEYRLVLRVLGERPEEKVRLLMSAKANERKQEEIVVVRDFLEVFPDDLSRLPPIPEIEFRIELIPGAMPVTKSPYRLTPSELEELSRQLKELQEKANVVADALSRKERVKPKIVRAINMNLQLSIKDRILAAQKEAMDEFA
ncbi:hypothetical protein Tco_1568072 [Tanacetum coccineum]